MRNVRSKASSASLEVITHRRRYAEIGRTRKAESEREDTLRTVKSLWRGTST